MVRQQIVNLKSAGSNPAPGALMSDSVVVARLTLNQLAKVRILLGQLSCQDRPILVFGIQAVQIVSRLVFGIFFATSR